MKDYISSRTYQCVQYNKRGDHPNDYAWAVAIPIVDEDPNNPFPVSGRLDHSLVKPEDWRYSVFETQDKDVKGKIFDLKLGWWIIELNGKVISVKSPEEFERNFKEKL